MGKKTVIKDGSMEHNNVLIKVTGKTITTIVLGKLRHEWFVKLGGFGRLLGNG